MNLETKFNMLYGWVDRIEHNRFPMDNLDEIRCANYFEELKRGGYKHEIGSLTDTTYLITLIAPDNAHISKELHKCNHKY